jgi:DNA-binding transcriptional ArsR family regulator
MKPLSNVTDAALVKALAHPLRVRILSVLEHRDASPTELATELDQPLTNMSYHVRKLERLGLIKLVRETPRRGAIEHHYRLDARPSISDEGWSRAPSIVKEALTGAVISQIGEEVAAAAGQGGFDRDDIHLSRLPVAVDERGFRALAVEAERFVETVRRIEEASRSRLAKAGADDELPGHVVLMLFEGAGDPPASTPARKRRSRGRRAKLKPKAPRAS